MKRLLVTCFLMLGCGGGGPPSQYQTCRDACAFQKKCVVGATDADVKACQAQCDADKAQLDASDAQIKAQCKNSGEILSGVHGCYTQDCDSTQAMACANAFTCQPK